MHTGTHELVHIVCIEGGTHRCTQVHIGYTWYAQREEPTARPCSQLAGW